MEILLKKFNEKILKFFGLILIFFIFGEFALIYKNKLRQNLTIPVVITAAGDVDLLGYTGQRKIAIDDKGKIFMAYRNKVGDHYEIFVSRFGKLNIMGTDKPISDVNVEVSQRVPSIAIDRKGILHVVWYGADSKDMPDARQIKYSRSVDYGRTWEKWRNIAYIKGYGGEDFWQEHPAILAGQNSEIYIVWEGKDEKFKKQQIKFVKSGDSGKNWEVPININPAKSVAQSRPTIVENSKGRIYVFMYSDLESEIIQIYYSFSDDFGYNWTKWKNISNSRYDSRHISAAIDKNDNIHLAWRSKSEEGGPSRIFYSVIKNNNDALPPKIVSESKKNQFFPNITVNKKSGKIYIIWMDSENNFGFPREKPEKGKIYYVFGTYEKFSDAIQTSKGDENFYPNFPLETNNIYPLPFIYSKGFDIGELILDWIVK